MLFESIDSLKIQANIITNLWESLQTIFGKQRDFAISQGKGKKKNLSGGGKRNEH